MARKIMVGMSGGVDSSVAAYLLKKQGYEVTGVTFKLWDDPTLESGCCSADDVRDAAYVCQQLGIPHYVLCGGIPARAHAEPLHQLQPIY